MRLRIVSVTMGGSTPTLGGSLSSGASTMTLAAALLDGQGNEIVVTSPDYLPVTIDPNSETAEVVWITTLTAGQTASVAITRNAEPAAQSGSAAQSHSSGAKLAFGALPADAGGDLATHQYTPGTNTSIGAVTAAATALSAFSATNATISFVAPSSGQVWVSLESGCQGSADVVGYWGLQDHTSHAAVGATTSVSTANLYGRYHAEILVTGLTPGTTYQYDWAGGTDDSSGFDLFGGPTYGPLTMRVTDAGLV